MRADEVEALLEAPLKKLPLPSRKGRDGSLHESKNHNSIDVVKEGQYVCDTFQSERNENRDSRDSRDDDVNKIHHSSHYSRGHERYGSRHHDDRSRTSSREASHYHRRRSPSYSRSRSRSRSPAQRHSSHSQSSGHTCSRPPPSASASSYHPSQSISTNNSVPSTISADKRTVFVRQIGQRVGEREVRRVCEQVGRVLSVRLVLDRHTRRHKGVAYVEYESEDSIPKALALTGTRLANIPLIFEVSDAEKNRIAAEAALQQRKIKLVEEQQKALMCRVRIEQLHPAATEEDVRRFFSDHGCITKLIVGEEVAEADFKNAMDAKRAVESLDRQLLLSRQIHLTLTSIDQSVINLHRLSSTSGNSVLEGDEFLSVTPQKRAELMLKLARSASVANKTLLLTNVGCDDDPEEVREEIKMECSKYGVITDIQLDTVQESVKVKFETSEQAAEAKSALDNRWFSGRRIYAKVQ